MEKKVIPPSTDAPSSPQITFCFRQLREHGQSPPAAIEFLKKAIQSGDAVPKPELPDGWRLEADGDELFVVWPGGRRNAREFSLYKPRYQRAPPDVFKPVPPPPGLMDKLYPPGYEPPKLSRAAQQSPPRVISGLARLRAENPDPPPMDPALAAALTKIADVLKPPDKPEVPKKADEPRKGGKPHRQQGDKPRMSLKQSISIAILADLFPPSRYPKGIPPEFSILQLVDMVAKEWDAKCDAMVPANAKRPTSPKWGAMKALLEQMQSADSLFIAITHDRDKRR
jgi:hypothetical protein